MMEKDHDLGSDMLSMYGLDVFYLRVLAVVVRPAERVFVNHFDLAVLEY
jgi:hypothetical protein